MGHRIKTARNAQHIYQMDLAEAAQIARSNLSKIETGKAEAGIETLHRIAKALNTTLSELLKDIN